MCMVAGISNGGAIRETANSFKNKPSMPLVPAFERQRKADLSKFKTTLAYQEFQANQGDKERP